MDHSLMFTDHDRGNHTRGKDQALTVNNQCLACARGEQREKESSTSGFAVCDGNDMCHAVAPFTDRQKEKHISIGWDRD